MTGDERDQWWNGLFAESEKRASETFEALMDRVEQLEREMAAAREVEHIDEGFKKALSHAYSRVEDLQAELAAARAKLADARRIEEDRDWIDDSPDVS